MNERVVGKCSEGGYLENCILQEHDLFTMSSLITSKVRFSLLGCKYHFYCQGIRTKNLVFPGLFVKKKDMLIPFK